MGLTHMKHGFVILWLQHPMQMLLLGCIFRFNIGMKALGVQVLEFKRVVGVFFKGLIYVI